jgi:type III restriction enzyme
LSLGKVHAGLLVLTHVQYEAIVTPGYTELRPAAWTGKERQTVHRVRDTVDEPSRINQKLFGHFERWLYPLQRFDSDTERRLAAIPGALPHQVAQAGEGQFQINYELDTKQPEYVRDFVVETDDAIRMVEARAKDNINTAEAQAKAAAASRWCQRGSPQSEHRREFLESFAGAA